MAEARILQKMVMHLEGWFEAYLCKVVFSSQELCSLHYAFLKK